MHRLALLLSAVAALALAACSAAGPAPAPTGPAASESPTTQPGTTMPAIEITRTGGFAGVHETLSVDGDGQWRTSTGGGQLGAAAQARLAELLADPGLLTEIAEAPPGRCCDMFQYTLRIGDPAPRALEFGEPDLGPLLLELLALLRAETGF